MSAALAIPVSQLSPSTSRQWLLAHVLAQLVCLGTAAGVYGLSHVIGATDPAAGQAMKTLALVLGLATELIYVVALAMLRGTVLRRVLPGFPMLAWTFAVTGALMFVPLLLAVTGSNAAPIKTVPQLTNAMLLSGFGFVVVLGFVFGLLVGSVEALVLRKVARGGGQWIKWSGFAWGGAMVAVYATGLIAVKNPQLSIASLAVLSVVMKIAQGLMIGAATLPALERLEPRYQADLKPAVAA